VGIPKDQSSMQIFAALALGDSEQTLKISSSVILSKAKACPELAEGNPLQARASGGV